jgi:transcriptional regulator with XRE-family HTH domain
MLTPRHLAKAPSSGRADRRAARRRGAADGGSSPDCPRCGSALVTNAIAGGPSEFVSQLRGGDAPIGAFSEWLCRSCGQRWAHDGAVSQTATGEERVDEFEGRTSAPGDLVELLDLPEEEHQPMVRATSRLVSTTLRRAREARGLTLSDAAKATYIWEPYLVALEAEAPLEEYPAPAYARSFLKSYAEYLGLDPAEMVREFDRSHPVRREPMLEVLPDPRPRRRVVATTLVVGSILSLAAIVLFPLTRDRDAEPTLPTAVAPATDAASGQDPVTRPPPPTVQGVRVVLYANDRCWVEASRDGEVVEAGTTLEPGDRVVYRADDILLLTLGSAGAVDLEVNGEPVRAGTAGEVVTVKLRVLDGELVTKIV